MNATTRTAATALRGIRIPCDLAAAAAFRRYIQKREERLRERVTFLPRPLEADAGSIEALARFVSS